MAVSVPMLVAAKPKTLYKKRLNGSRILLGLVGCSSASCNELQNLIQEWVENLTWVSC